MYYDRICPGIFLRRPNRFLAEIEIEGKKEICHVKNTGRCRELLIPGAEVYVQKAAGPNRKTAYDLIAVQKGETLVNMDSQIPNRVVEEWLRKELLLRDISILRREVTFENSRFDLYAEYGRSIFSAAGDSVLPDPSQTKGASEEKSGKKAFLEVKGVTLEENGIARFPDAPTERGVKHLTELCRCAAAGYEAYVIFVIQMKGVRQMEPNWNTHRAFGEALVKAKQEGVHVLSYDCVVTPETITLDREVPVVL